MKLKIVIGLTVGCVLVGGSGLLAMAIGSPPRTTEPLSPIVVSRPAYPEGLRPSRTATTPATGTPGAAPTTPTSDASAPSAQVPDAPKSAGGSGGSTAEEGKGSGQENSKPDSDQGRAEEVKVDEEDVREVVIPPVRDSEDEGEGPEGEEPPESQSNPDRGEEESAADRD